MLVSVRRTLLTAQAGYPSTQLVCAERRHSSLPSVIFGPPVFVDAVFELNSSEPPCTVVHLLVANNGLHAATPSQLAVLIKVLLSGHHRLGL